MFASASPVGLRSVVRAGRLRRRHALPFPGRILVDAGDPVTLGQIWARGRVRTGITVVDLPRLLRVEVAEARRLVAVTLGATVDEGTLLAGTAGRVRTGRQWLAPSRGMLAEVSPKTAVAVFVQDVLEVALHCRLAGRVADVEPGAAIVVEGPGVAVAAALGAGGRALGTLHVVEAGERPRDDAGVPPGAVLMTPDPIRPDWVRRAVEVRAAAVIAPSGDDEALSLLALAPALAGMTPPSGAPAAPPLPIVLTEGAGHVRMPLALQGVFRAAAGQMVAVTGTRKPGESEVVLPAGPAERAVERAREDGIPVRVTAGLETGEEGVLEATASEGSRAASGAPAVCVRVRRLEGGELVVPLRNLEALA
ncbi:MAG: hypothetical protein FJ029_02335 [Actinobacteria bacterium]|nr:hypothetical protein [Actinomycetota bacterium]